MIIFDGQEIVVHRNNHFGDYLVITFCPAGVSENSRSGFFAESPLNKLKIPSVGITAKYDYWFISDEESEWLPLVQEIAAEYKKVIVIGCSMGAHAAIRLSAALRANIVLALSPKWSLDRNECSHIDDRYTESNFRDSMRGMGLREHHTHGKIFLLYDPLDNIDAYHSQKIKENIKSTIEIRLFHIGHGIIDFISGSSNMKKILDSSISENTYEIIKTICEIKRKHPRTVGFMLECFCERKPLLSYRAFEKVKADKSHKYASVMKESRIAGRLPYFLRRAGYRDESYSVIEALDSAVLPGSVRRERDYTPPRGNKEYHLLSYHGFSLVYDIRAQCLRGQCIAFPDSGCVPVSVFPDSENIYLKIKFDGREYYLITDENGVSVSPDYNKDSVFRLVESRAQEWFAHFNATTDERGYAIASRHGLVIMFPDGTVGLNCRNDHKFESFVLLPAPVNQSSTQSQTDICP